MGLDSPVIPPPPLTSFIGCRSPTLVRSCLTRRQVDWITMTFGLCVFTPKNASGFSQTARGEGVWTTAYAILFIFISSSVAAFCLAQRYCSLKSPRVLVRLDHVAGSIVNVDHSVIGPDKTCWIRDQRVFCWRPACTRAQEKVTGVLLFRCGAAIEKARLSATWGCNL